MNRFERILLIGSSVLTAFSGAVYGVMKYLVTSSDPYAVVNHPWQPFFLKFHILASPFLVFALGLIFRGHVLDRWQSGGKAARRTGRIIAWLFLPMAASGYLIQAITGGTALQGAVWTHLVTGGAFVAGLSLHRNRAFRWFTERRRASVPVAEGDWEA